jgi:predicted permease
MSLAQDVRFGLRLLLRRPGYAIVVALTLALAIGANTVIFSFVNVLLIRPLPIAEPETLGWLYSLDPQRGVTRGRTSYLDFADLRAASRSFVTLSAFSTDNVTLTGRGEPQRLQASKVSATAFETWGLKPLVGRTLLADEDVPGAPCAVVLSHKVWKAQFQSDRNLISQSLTIDGLPCTVVGVLHPSIEFGNLALTDVWMPIALDPAKARRDERIYSIVGRLRPGITHEQADAEVKAIMGRLSTEHPETNRNWKARIAKTKEAIAGEDTWVILTLLGLVVGFVLLIACANVSNLALARVAGRRRELAVRAALGASRWRTVRLLGVEGLLLGAAGGALGLGLAEAGLRAIRAAAYEQIFELITIDRNVLIFAAAVSILSPILFSVLPALIASDEKLGEALKEGGRTAGALRARRSRHALVVTQVALALTLLVVATLIVRSMIEINRFDVGFDPRPLLTAQIEAPEWKFASDGSITRLYDDLLARLRRSPGVEAAAAVSGLPLLSTGARVSFAISGRPDGTDADRPWAMRFVASDEYFRATGVPMIAGRAFAGGDRPDTEPIAIVNAEAARRYWTSPQQALGARISAAPAGEAPRWMHVVGVAANTANPDLDMAPDPQIFVPLAQRPSRAMALVVRSPRPVEVAGAVRAAVRAADADVPVFQVRTLEEALDDELSSSRIIAAMFAAFAVLALVLASTGIYGVISYAVGQRTQEIGVRMALGALPADIRRLVVGQGLRLVAIGAAIGLLGAFLVSRSMSRVLFGVTATDPRTYLGVVLAVMASAGLAMWTPMRRATRLDPVRSLRAE